MYTFGTFSFKSDAYHPLQPFADVLYDCYHVPLGHVSTRSAADLAYIYPQPSPAVDVFALGMTMLCMLLRYGLPKKVVLWMKYEISVCKKVDVTGCSPAHVLLYHPLPDSRFVNPLLKDCGGQKFDIIPFLSLIEGRRFRCTYERLQKEVNSKLISPDLCNLLERMTASDHTKRPSVEECINCCAQIKTFLF